MQKTEPPISIVTRFLLRWFLSEALHFQFCFSCGIIIEAMEDTFNVSSSFVLWGIYGADLGIYCRLFCQRRIYLQLRRHVSIFNSVDISIVACIFNLIYHARAIICHPEDISIKEGGFEFDLPRASSTDHPQNTFLFLYGLWIIDQLMQLFAVFFGTFNRFFLFTTYAGVSYKRSRHVNLFPFSLSDAFVKEATISSISLLSRDLHWQPIKCPLMIHF